MSATLHLTTTDEVMERKARSLVGAITTRLMGWLDRGLMHDEESLNSAMGRLSGIDLERFESDGMSSFVFGLQRGVPKRTWNRRSALLMLMAMEQSEPHKK